MSHIPSALTAAILAVRERLVSSGEYASFAAINAGYCDGFCSDVVEAMDLPDGVEAPEELCIANLMESEDGEPTAMDRELLASAWPGIQPPDGLDWDDLDRLAAEADFSAGTHVWLCLGDRHYDSEAPEGVVNVFDLPFFQRIVSASLDQRHARRP